MKVIHHLTNCAQNEGKKQDMKKTMIWKAVKGWHILGKIRSPFLTPCLERQKQKIFAFFTVYPFPYLTRGPLTNLLW